VGGIPSGLRLDSQPFGQQVEQLRDLLAGGL